MRRALLCADAWRHACSALSHNALPYAPCVSNTATCHGGLSSARVGNSPSCQQDVWRRWASSLGASSTSPAQSDKDLYMAFTCGRCDTRAVKGFTRQAYERGLVIVTCPGCNVRHLIADNLGWFGDNGNVEDFVKANGDQAVRMSADGTMEYDAETMESLIRGRSSAGAAATREDSQQ